MSQYEPAAGQPTTPGTPPPSVVTAVRLIWVSVGLSVISAVISFVLLDDLVDAATEGADVDADAARVGAVVGLVIGLIIGVALTALLAVFINKGANWARITYTVLGILGILLGLVGIGNQPGLLLVVGLVSVVLTLVILFLLYRPDANPYFKTSRFADGS